MAEAIAVVEPEEEEKEVPAPEVPLPAEEADDKVSSLIEAVDVNTEPEVKMTEDEILRQKYLAEIAARPELDARLKTNLEYMMQMNCLNFQLNINLLARTKNDLGAALDALFSGNLRESVFTDNN